MYLPTLSRSPQGRKAGAAPPDAELEVGGGFPGTICAFAVLRSCLCLEKQALTAVCWQVWATLRAVTGRCSRYSLPIHSLDPSPPDTLFCVPCCRPVDSGTNECTVGRQETSVRRTLCCRDACESGELRECPCGCRTDAMGTFMVPQQSPTLERCVLFTMLVGGSAAVRTWTRKEVQERATSLRVLSRTT